MAWSLTEATDTLQNQWPLFKNLDLCHFYSVLTPVQTRKISQDKHLASIAYPDSEFWVITHNTGFFYLLRLNSLRT